MPKTQSSLLRLQDYLPYRLSVAANEVSRLIAQAYKEQFGLSIPGWRLITVLAQEGALTQQSLCGHTIMDKVTVMRAAQELLRRRLVRRSPHADDKRSHLLDLTAMGQRLYAEVAPLALEYEAQLLADMKKEDVALMQRWLLQLQQRASQLNSATS